MNLSIAVIRHILLTPLSLQWESFAEQIFTQDLLDRYHEE